MSYSRLFDASPYGEGTKRPERKPKDPALVVPWREPWKLLTSKNGVIGHHLVKGKTKGGSLLAKCGKVGVPITGHTKQMVECPECAEP